MPSTITDSEPSVETEISDNTTITDVYTIEGEVGTIEGEVGTIEGEVGTIEGRVGTIEGRVGTIEGRVGIIEGGVGAPETSCNDFQMIMSSYPQTAPYSSIFNISRDMALDLYERATRVVRYVQNDSLATNAIKYKNYVISRLKKRPARQEFNCEEVILAVISIVGFLYNLVVDVLVTVMYWREGNRGFALTTLAALIGPLIIVNVISMMWYKDADHECSVEPVLLQRANRWSGPLAWGLCGWMHTMLLGQLYRTVIMIYVGIKSWGEDRARERRKSAVSNAIASYYRQMDQSDDGSATSVTSDSAPLSLPSPPDCDLILPGCEPCVDYYSMFVHQECDIAVLDLLDGFLHDGTQVILQFYLILKPETADEEEHEVYLREIAQIQSATVALFTLSWCFSEYIRAMRSADPHKRKLNLLGMILMFIWRLLTLVPRVYAFGLFATCAGYYLLLFIFMHWMLMSVWVHLQKSAEGQPNNWLAMGICLVIGYVHIFCMLKIKETEEPTRAKYIFFYSLLFLENSFLLCYWHFHTKSTNGLSMITALTGTYFVGIMFMLMYYKWVHPQDHLPDKTRRARLV